MKNRKVGVDEEKGRIEDKRGTTSFFGLVVLSSFFVSFILIKIVKM